MGFRSLMIRYRASLAARRTRYARLLAPRSWRGSLFARRRQRIQYLIRYHRCMDSPQTIIRQARLAAGLSQRALAMRASTSQPAIARYERGVATPSWETLARLMTACGRKLTLK